MSDPRLDILTFARKQGVIRTSDVTALGINRLYLYDLEKAGKIIRSARGIYALADYEVTEAHSLVEAVKTQARGIVCLLSALSFHDIGTQQPHQVWLAVPYGSWISERRTAPVRIAVMRSSGYEAGIENHRLEGVDVPIYSIPKTVADCFKFRHKIGLDVALEALHETLRERRCNSEEIRKYAKINRVEQVMRPYMEAMAI